jgi:hypothetical protein
LVILTNWADIFTYYYVFVQNSLDIFAYRYVFVANRSDIFADCYAFVANRSDIFAYFNVLNANGLLLYQKAMVYLTITSVCIAYWAGNFAKPSCHLVNSLSEPNTQMV